MKNVTVSSSSEIMGLDEFLERYTNPINRQMYNELLDIFITKEEMDIFTSISEMINKEEQIEAGDITSIFNGLVKRSAISTIKNVYGIILTEDIEIRLPDLYSALLSLQYLVGVDRERADKFKSIIDDRENDLDAYILILRDMGVDINFIHNYIIGVEDYFLDAYAKILKDEIEKQELEDEDIESMIELNHVISLLKTILLDKKSNLLHLAISRLSFLRESDMLDVINNESLPAELIPYEMLAGYKLLKSDESVSSFFKEYTENIVFSSLQEEEECFIIFRDLENKYKTEDSKRIKK